jgi:hypothetical protein
LVVDATFWWHWRICLFSFFHVTWQFIIEHRVSGKRSRNKAIMEMNATKAIRWTNKLRSSTSSIGGWRWKVNITEESKRLKILKIAKKNRKECEVIGISNHVSINVKASIENLVWLSNYTPLFLKSEKTESVMFLKVCGKSDVNSISKQII